MFRLMGKTFYGESHVDPRGRAEHPRVAPIDDRCRSILLAIPTVLLGLVIGLPLGRLADPALARARLPAAPRRRCASSSPSTSSSASTARSSSSRSRSPRSASALGIWLFGFFRREASARRVERLTAPQRRDPLYDASFHKWWFDDLNDLIFVRFGGAVARSVMWFDVRVIDGTVNGIGDRDPEHRPRHPPHPDRPRPELRAGHRRRAARHRRLVHVHGALMIDIGRSLLSLIIFLPLVGALVIAFLPRERTACDPLGGARDAARRVGPLARAPGSRSTRSAGLPVRRGGRLDRLLRHPVQARRRRHLARAGRAHDAP